LPGFLKDDRTVALDEVDRVASRIITIYRDLAAITQDQRSAQTLVAEADRRAAALADFNRERQAHGQIPEVDDPELSHIQAMWLKLRSLLATSAADEVLAQSLADLDDALRDAVNTARALQPDGNLRDALEHLLPPTADLRQGS
jgi:mannitol-1-phosphate/altronate dehydrogenase